MTLTATDLFCGAGGSSLGAEVAGAEIEMAANHSPKACEVYSVNHHRTRVDCADISQVDPRRYPRTDLLLASPECTNHSSAKGVSRKRQDPSLFDSPDLVAERSRATMWDVHRFVEVHQYDAVIVENVVDAARWVYWPSWWQAFDDAGYEAKVVNLNSAHTGLVPQWRDRIYVVAVRRGVKVDLELRPPSWCPTCETVVAGVQSFKRPDRRVGKWRQQYHYRCPSCAEIVAPPAPPAASIIDWSLPAGRIGDRKRPLAEATLRRIRLGIERYGAALVAGAGNTWERPGSEYARAWPLNQPTPAQSCTTQHGVAHPDAFLVSGMSSHDPSKIRSVAEPTFTSTASSRPFLVQPHHTGDDGSRVRSIDDPYFTATASRDVPALVVPMRRNCVGQPPGWPAPTVCASGGHHGLLMAPQSDGRAMSTDRPAPSLTAKVPPILVPYDRTSNPRPVTAPTPAMRTHDSAALVHPEIDVDDCRFRMLEPHEVKAAMAFPAGYLADGTKAELVKLWGNAVTPPVMTWLAQQVSEALEAAG